MEKLNGITITQKDLKWYRKLGEGRDAIVYSAPHSKAYKIYKNPTNKNYVGVLKMIQDNNYNIKLSHLPQGAIYSKDGAFIGSLLERVYGKQIHYVFPSLSREKQIILLKRVVAAVKELTKNYIYPCDIANTPLLPRKRSNILVDRKLNPQLIDIDGSGAKYRSEYNKYDQYDVDRALSILFADLVFDMPFEEDPERYEVDWLREKLINNGFDRDVADKISIYEADYEVIDEAIKQYSLIPKIK